MPLTELMNYFNDQLQTQARIRSLPKIGFFKADRQYWARFGNLILGSRFQAIYPLTPSHLLTPGEPLTGEPLAGEPLIGHNSELLVRSTTGNSLDIHSLFNSLDSTDQIIQLDRLVRTLHSLNYLEQYDGHKTLLSLQVQSRHVISVTHDHGKAFETILGDCGLVPARVLLHTRLLNDETLHHFHNALHSYRRRGYQLGISLSEPYDIELLDRLDVIPDVVLIDHALSTATEHLDRFYKQAVQIIVVGTEPRASQGIGAPWDGHAQHESHLFHDGELALEKKGPLKTGPLLI